MEVNRRKKEAETTMCRASKEWVLLEREKAISLNALRSCRAAPKLLALASPICINVTCTGQAIVLPLTRAVHVEQQKSILGAPQSFCHRSLRSATLMIARRVRYLRSLTNATPVVCRGPHAKTSAATITMQRTIAGPAGQLKSEEAVVMAKK